MAPANAVPGSRQQLYQLTGVYKVKSVQPTKTAPGHPQGFSSHSKSDVALGEWLRGLSAATGAGLAELMARLGHPQAAMRYQHAAQGRDKQIAALLSKLAANAVTP
jgi:hypothetical protein